MTDTLSVLTHPHASCLLAKKWLANGGIDAYGKGKNFKLGLVSVGGIEELSALLTKLAPKPTSCIIRGAYVGDELARAANPDYVEGKVRRIGGVFVDQPLHATLIEVDEYVPHTADPVLEPEACAEEYIRAVLPSCFHGVSYHWQLSSSAGHPTKKGKFKAHLWFWLNTPYTSYQLNEWVKAQKIACDSSVFNIVQANYTANPVFEEGVVDPVPLRCGFVAGIVDDVVDLVIDIAHVEHSYADRDALPTPETLPNDPLACFLYNNGLVDGIGNKGQLFMNCPFEDEHQSGSKNETEFCYFMVGTGGKDFGAFDCKHQSCKERKQAEFHAALGYTPLPVDCSGDFEPQAVAAEYITEREAIRATAKEDAEDAKTRCLLKSVEEFTNRPEKLWLIDDVLPAAGLGVNFGASGSGKSFIMLDMICHIVRGMPWRGKATTKTKVVYVCAEGEDGFARRLQAYMKYHDLTFSDLEGLRIVEDNPDFSKTDHLLLIERIKASGEGVGLIVIDTLMQVSAGCDENSSKDMGAVLKNCRVLKKKTEAMIELVHHTGKDVLRGSRGWSGIKGACDSELSTSYDKEKNKDYRWLSVTKNKDGKEDDIFPFRLVDVHLGVNSRGGSIISAVAIECAAVAQDRRQELTDGQREMLIDVHEVCGVGGSVLRVKFVKEYASEHYVGDRNGKTKVDRVLNALIKRKNLTEKNGELVVLDAEAEF